MYTRKGFIVVIALLGIMLLSLAPKAWSWNDAGSGVYLNAKNLTVNNWNYTATYGPTLFTAGKTGYVLVNISLKGNPTSISIQGYGKSKNDIGGVPYTFVSIQNNATILLIPNVTSSGQVWSFATIFYNPISTQLLNNSPLAPKTVSLCSTFLSTKVVNGEILLFCALSYNAIKLTTIGFLNGSFTPSYSNSSFATFHTNYTGSSGFVVLANRSLVSTGFNISWYPDANPYSIRAYDISNTYTGYKLTSINNIPFLSSSVVSNAPLNSQNANFIFNSLVPYDNKGFEGYFNTQSNQIISEGMIVDEGATSVGRPIGTLYNSTISNGIAFDGTNKGLQFSLSVRNYSPTSFIVMPAFSRNYTLTSVAVNPTPIAQDNSGCGSIFNLAGWYCNFLYRIPISVNWSYNFTTYAYPHNLSIAHKIVFRNGSVPYLLLNVTNYLQFGSNCQYVYFRAYNSLTDTDYGAIPFTVLNCTPTSGKATFILANTTNESYTYSSFFMYYGSALNNTPDFSNSIVASNWKFEVNSNSFNVITSGIGVLPYIEQLSAPLNLYSHINTSYGNFAQALLAYNGHIASYDTINVVNNTKTLYPETKFIFFGGASYGNTIGANVAFFSGSSTFFINHTNLTKYANNSASVFFGEHTSPVNVYTALANGITANAEYPYTTQYTIGVIQERSLTNLSSGNRPNTPAGAPNIPNSSDTLNYTHTTTINFNSLSTLVYVYPALGVPKYDLIVLALICLILGAITFEATKSGHISFIFILIAIWILGIWQIPLLILGMILTVVFILFEFIDKGGLLHELI